MAAKTPQWICSLFKRYMAAGDLDSVLGLYDEEAVFLNQSGEAKRSRQGLKEELAPFAAEKARFEFKVRQVIQSGDIALMHTDWKVSSLNHQASLRAIEVARRQPDGTWRWLIGDSYSISRRLALQIAVAA